MPIALAVVTRDRAELLERLLPSLLAQAPDADEIVVVDQSGGNGTRELIAGAAGVRYLRSPPGLSRGRNVAIAETSAPLLAFTDDDVILPDGWLARLGALFEPHRDAGAVCGRAAAADGMLLPGARAGVYRWPTHPFRLGSGFNIAFRRAALDEVGPFDEELGAGARYRAGEDTEMLYRLLRADWSVVCSDEIGIVHDDRRSRRAETALHYRYGVGAGAQTAKHVAAGDRTAAWIAVREAAGHFYWLAYNLAKLRPRAASVQLPFVAGMLVGAARRFAASRRRAPA